MRVLRWLGAFFVVAVIVAAVLGIVGTEQSQQTPFVDSGFVAIPANGSCHSSQKGLDLEIKPQYIRRYKRTGESTVVMQASGNFRPEDAVWSNGSSGSNPEILLNVRGGTVITFAVRDESDPSKTLAGCTTTIIHK